MDLYSSCNYPVSELVMILHNALNLNEALISLSLRLNTYSRLKKGSPWNKSHVRSEISDPRLSSKISISGIASLQLYFFKLLFNHHVIVSTSKYHQKWSPKRATCSMCHLTAMQELQRFQSPATELSRSHSSDQNWESWVSCWVCDHVFAWSSPWRYTFRVNVIWLIC